MYNINLYICHKIKCYKTEFFWIKSMASHVGISLLDDHPDDLIGLEDQMSTRQILPDKISGTYSRDFNIIHVDNIIREKLRSERYNHLENLERKYSQLDNLSRRPQTYIMRGKTLDDMKNVQEEIRQIKSGDKLRVYDKEVVDILKKYRECNTKILDSSTDDESKLTEEVGLRISLIEDFLEVARKYIPIDVIRVSTSRGDVCIGCGCSLEQVAPSEEGCIRCPNPECGTEHNQIITVKSSKDNARININSNTDDESIDNFLRAFMRYQGLQLDGPSDSIYQKLDAYFSRLGRPNGETIRKLPLNKRGRRGDTDHNMLWTALSKIGHPECYEHANLIGHKYWGWQLPDVMHLKESIIDKYNKTQKVFYQIPPEERGRNSSLGTQYRLWRHLQLEGHECYMDEFKIAENTESLRTHHKLWKLMCEGTDDPDIYFISGNTMTSNLGLSPERKI